MMLVDLVKPRTLLPQESDMCNQNIQKNYTVGMISISYPQYAWRYIGKLINFNIFFRALDKTFDGFEL